MQPPSKLITTIELRAVEHQTVLNMPDSFKTNEPLLPYPHTLKELQKTRGPPSIQQPSEVSIPESSLHLKGRSI